MGLPGTMSHFGPVMQIAYVPADFDAALHFWTTVMGVGPFFVRRHVALARATYRGKDSVIDFDMALSYWGDVQIEIIRQNCDTPSIYSTWRAAGHEGVHHVCVQVDSMAAVRSAAQQTGVQVVQEAFMMHGAGEAIYVDTGGGPGTMVEYICLTPPLLEGFAAIRAAAAHWDGSDPIRER